MLSESESIFTDELFCELEIQTKTLTVFPDQGQEIKRPMVNEGCPPSDPVHFLSVGHHFLTKIITAFNLPLCC